MDLLEKFKELHSNGQPMQDIVENIFLNYNAYTNNDDIYCIKKKIANEFKVELNNVKLIGSSHTGFKDFKKKINTKDYDFAIIDPFLFRKYLLKININRMDNSTKNSYTKNLSRGKIHILYVTQNIRTDIENIMEGIKESVEEERNKKISQDLTICFYISEEAFIKNLILFFNKVLLETMQQKKLDDGKLKELDKLH